MLLNSGSAYCDIFLANLLDESHRESVPGDDPMIHQLNKGRQSEGEQVTEARGQQTHKHSQTTGKFFSTKSLGAT